MSDPEDGPPRHGPSDATADDPSPDDSNGTSDSTRDRDATPGPSGDGGSARPDGSDRPSGLLGWLKWFWTTDSGTAVYVRDVLTSVAAVLLVGVLLFAVSGLWPPMVAIESSSMEPNMDVGDLVFVVDNERFVPGEAVAHEGQTTGIVPADVASETGHSEFGKHGDVIVFMPDGNAGRTPVIHRAMLWVDAGENWYDRADPDAVADADDCEELNNCPAPHAGFVTKGDNQVTNSNYDQQSTLSTPVKPVWIVGTAELKVPYLGYVRLAFSGQTAMPLEPIAATPGEPADGGATPDSTAPTTTERPANATLSATA